MKEKDGGEEKDGPTNNHQPLSFQTQKNPEAQHSAMCAAKKEVRTKLRNTKGRTSQSTALDPAW